MHLKSDQQRLLPRVTQRNFMQNTSTTKEIAIYLSSSLATRQLTRRQQLNPEQILFLLIPQRECRIVEDL